MSDLKKYFEGYKEFKDKYYHQDNSVMKMLAEQGQKPKSIVIACCDSRVDPAILLQCDPGELFVVRNVANIVPPFENDEHHHGTSAALEFAVCYLEVENIIIIGHSQCGGIDALINQKDLKQDDFISHWVSLTNLSSKDATNPNELAKMSLARSYQNCLTFPWLKAKVDANKLNIHCWYFDMQNASLQAFDPNKKAFAEVGE